MPAPRPGSTAITTITACTIPFSVSKDGKYSIEFVECLASCGTAPVCMVQDELVENVRPESAPALLAHNPSPINQSSNLLPIPSNIA